MHDQPLLTSAFSNTILAIDEPPPVAVHNAGASSPFLLVGDHAGNKIPRVLNSLGLNSADLGRHIALDIGFAGLGARLADELGSSFIHRVYSRLVIACTPPPGTRVPMPGCCAGT